MIDAGRDMMAIGACPQKERRITRSHVPASERGHMAFDRHFAGVVGKTLNLARQAGLGGHIDKKVVNRRGADPVEHRSAIGIRQGKIAHERSSSIRSFAPCFP